MQQYGETCEIILTGGSLTLAYLLYDYIYIKIKIMKTSLW